MHLIRSSSQNKHGTKTLTGSTSPMITTSRAGTFIRSLIRTTLISTTLTIIRLSVRSEPTIGRIRIFHGGCDPIDNLLLQSFQDLRRCFPIIEFHHHITSLRQHQSSSTHPTPGRGGAYIPKLAICLIVKIFNLFKSPIL